MKKISALILALIMLIFSLVGCGRKDKNSDSASGSQSPSASMSEKPSASKSDSTVTPENSSLMSDAEDLIDSGEAKARQYENYMRSQIDMPQRDVLAE